MKFLYYSSLLCLLEQQRISVAKAKDFLQNLIREKDMPPKPTLDIDIHKFRHMRNLMIKVQDKVSSVKNPLTEIADKH